MNIQKDRSIPLRVACGDTMRLLTVFYCDPRSVPRSPSGVVAGVGGGKCSAGLRADLGFSRACPWPVTCIRVSRVCFLPTLA